MRVVRRRQQAAPAVARIDIIYLSHHVCAALSPYWLLLRARVLMPRARLVAALEHPVPHARLTVACCRHVASQTCLLYEAVAWERVLVP